MRDVLKLCVDTPQEQNLWDFTVVDDENRPLAVQPQGRREKTTPVHDPDTRPWPFYLDRHTVYLETGPIPAGGYKVLRVVPGRTFNRKAEILGCHPHQPRRRPGHGRQRLGKPVAQGSRYAQRHVGSFRYRERPVVPRPVALRGHGRRGRLLDLLSAL